MGGIVGLVTAALLAQNYGYSVPLCVLDNTPSKTQDVRGNSKQLLLAFLASAGRYGMHGGPLARFLSVAGSHLSDGESLEESLRYARDEAIPSAPYNYNRTNQIQAEVIETAPHNLRWGSAQLQETLLAYILPKIPESDRTVDGQSAYASLQKDFPDIRQIRIPGGEHGVNHATREQYYQEIAQLAAAAGILPISQRTHKHSELPSTVSALPRSL
jgi:hypothetical protein